MIPCEGDGSLHSGNGCPNEGLACPDQGSHCPHAGERCPGEGSRRLGRARARNSLSKGFCRDVPSPSTTTCRRPRGRWDVSAGGQAAGITKSFVRANPGPARLGLKPQAIQMSPFQGETWTSPGLSHPCRRWWMEDPALRRDVPPSPWPAQVVVDGLGTSLQNKKPGAVQMVWGRGRVKRALQEERGSPPRSRSPATCR
jgi:hypothetical protein